jgi:uncharacterized protein (DUF1800 family)
MPAMARPLDRIDPAEAWQPWRPTAADPWSRKWAAHLYRRAAFGPSANDLVEAERRGPDGTLELLMHGPPHADELRQTLTDVGRIAAEHDDGGEQLRGWWLYCMFHGHPLREKMTLFWHNHFATSIVKVQSSELMFRQNCLLRSHALGKFGPMLQEISRDGAMLIWLDSNRNVVGHPNENYARELMELFSLGVGHYSEADIREAARAFTGWHTDGHRFTFQARLHDAGVKAVFGQTGNWNGDDIVRIVLAQPAVSHFLVRKLYRYFISEAEEPPEPLLEPLVEIFRASDYDIAALVRTVLSSRHFYSEHAFRRRVKSPVEFLLGAVNALIRPSRDGNPDNHPIPQQALASRLAAMDQPLFAPPNVKGWPGGRAWLNTATMLERDNFAAALATGTLWNNPTSRATVAITSAIGPIDRQSAASPAFDCARAVREDGGVTPEDAVRTLLDLHLPGGVRSEARAKLVAFLGVPGDRDQRIREAVHAIMTMPEYQLA